MANETEQLLSTEQAVQQLLKELETLMKQVGGYDHAKQSLEEVRQGLRGLIERTSSLAEQTQSATATLGKIGTPEILARVDNAKSAVTQSVEATGGKVGGGIEASTKAVVSAIRELAMRSEEARKAQEADARFGRAIIRPSADDGARRAGRAARAALGASPQLRRRPLECRNSLPNGSFRAETHGRSTFASRGGS